MESRAVVRLAAAVTGLLLVRRLARRSGVTDAELRARLPGDDLLPDPMVQWTRATTIGAPREEVWPWLAQMGYGRGGWYTSERFDRLVWRIENRSAETVLEEWQQPATGDIIPDGPGHAAYFRLALVERPEALVYRSIRHPFRGHPVDPTDDAQLDRREQRLRRGGVFFNFSWAWVLRADGHRTRLIVRTRADCAPRWLRAAAVPLRLVDLFHVTSMFRGIRRRVAAARADFVRGPVDR